MMSVAFFKGKLKFGIILTQKSCAIFYAVTRYLFTMEAWVD
jgi:hypothetical protein